MKFNSQICTSREQSERLLALGLKPETADIIKETTEVKNGVTTTSIDYSWSLHRLIEMALRYVLICGISFTFNEDAYEKVIEIIEFQINDGNFPKEYLQHSENTREEGR